MYARVTQLELDLVRTSVPAALERFREEVLPDLREEDGYAGVYLLNTGDGAGLIVSLWESEDAVRKGVELQQARLERFVTLLRSPAGRELYAVAFVDLPQHV